MMSSDTDSDPELPAALVYQYLSDEDEDVGDTDRDEDIGDYAGDGGGDRLDVIQQALEQHEEHSADCDINFDSSIVPQHAYLGRGEEIHGRTVLEDGSLVELPLLCDPSVILVPGQTLPLSIYHPASIAMMRRVVDNNLTFGFVKARLGEDLLEKAVGTTAEIYEMKDDTTDTYTGFVIKAKGRQRFRIVSVRSLVTGTLMGRVRILGDTLPDEPFAASRGRAAWRLRLAPIPRRPADDRQVQAETPPLVAADRLDTAGARWPGWLYGMYAAPRLVRAVRAGLQRCLMARPERVPTDPTELSYWVAMSLPLDDNVRLQLLRMDSVVRRLRAEVGIMERFEVLTCRDCGVPVARMEDVFSMSAAGPQSIFVNANGHLHETLTVYRADHLRCITRPTAEFSWFDGYRWEIAQCARCSAHMGWRFTSGARRRLRPHSFWGLSRTALTPRTADDAAADPAIRQLQQPMVL